YVVRFIEFMPLDADQVWREDRVLTGGEIRALIEERWPLVEIPAAPSSTARRFRFADGAGEIGFVNPVSEPFCSTCDRIRLTAVAAVGRRYLPRGWADFGRQLSIWFGFLIAYQFVRGLADRNPSKAFDNGWRVLGVEQGMTHHIFELTLQRVAESSSFLNRLTSLTYWTSEFAVVGIALLYVYLRRHDSFSRFRNWILLANVLGLVGYLLLPTAPPRMFQSLGFIDTLGNLGSMNHGSSLVQVAGNPY